MHLSAENAHISDHGISFVVEVNGLDGIVELQAENGHLTGEMFIKEVNMRFKVDMNKTADDYTFCDLYYVVTEENREILRTNNTYTTAPAPFSITYELENQGVLKIARDLGITLENHHDFASIYELMEKTEHVIHQDGVNYCHSKDHGTIAQLKHAMGQNNLTNCRGISIIFSGILRAYGFRASYVECWPADPSSSEIHVVCEVYAPDLKKYVAVDISNRMIFFKDHVPLSLFELRNAIVSGEEDLLTCNENVRNSLNEVLAYLSKNLVVFCKQRDNNESDEIGENNAVCLAPEELREVFASKWNLQHVTSNPKSFFCNAE